jgi:hypothetical protein
MPDNMDQLAAAFGFKDQVLGKELPNMDSSR